MIPDGQFAEWHHLKHLANHAAGIDAPLPNIIGYMP